jgi:uncharacterized protein YjeT (DUF2065 family)
MEEILIGLLCIIVGICSIMDPRLAWKMSRWKYKHTEPSDEMQYWIRIVGYIAVAVGICFFGI